MSTDIDLEDAQAFAEAVDEALRESVDRHGLDPEALLDPYSDVGARFLEGLNDLVEDDPDAPSFALAVEAVARDFADANPELRVVEAEEVERVPGRVLEARPNAADGGRVFRVEILRYGASKNGNRYTEAVMRRDAHRYEGAKAFDHHRTPQELQSSTLAGLVGSYRNVEATGNALEADLHLLPSAVHTAEALDASLEAQTAGRPPVVGISHDVMASFKPAQLAGGKRIREAVAITAVQSADVVADPSAGGRAVRVVQGGIETTPEGAEQTQESEVPVTTQDVLAALSSASEQQLAAHGLSRTGTPITEAVTPPERTVESERTTEAAQPKTSFMGKMLIRSKVEDAGLPARIIESFTVGLPDYITEAAVDAAIATLKSSIAVIEGPTLQGTASGVVTHESRDKVIEGLDKALAGDYSVFNSIRKVHEAFTGYRPRSWGEDQNRVILRESAGGLYDSSMRTTESMNTSSWDQVLGDSITRRAIALYNQPALRSWEAIVSDRVPINDFRTQRRVRVGGYGTLPVVTQGAPYQPLTSPSDEEVTYALEKKGGTEDLTLEMIAADDLHLLAQIPKKLGLAAAITLRNFVWDFLATNPTIYDSVALFHSSHANTTAAAISQTNVSSLRQKMRDQTAYGDTSNILSLVPRFLVVPNELEVKGFQLTQSAVAIPATPDGPSDTPNIHQGMQLITQDYLTDADDWFLIADPSMCPTIELGFYQGREDPEIFTQSDNSVGSVFNNDSLTYKVRHIYKGAVLDYRGFQRGTQ